MREPSPYAGQTAKLRIEAFEIGGLDAAVVDWYERTNLGQSWRDQLDSDPRAANYNVRRGLAGLPDDDDVLFARVDGMGRLVHLTEIEGATGAVQTPTGPSLVDQRVVGMACPACEQPLEADALVATLKLGPGADPAQRERARAGLPYEGVLQQIHWACHTGDESYSTEA